MRGLIVQVTVGLQPGADGLAQLYDARGGGIAGKVVTDGGDTGLLDVIRRIKIGFTGAETDHINAVGLHLLEQGVNGQCRGCADSLCGLGQLFHNKLLQLAIKITMTHYMTQLAELQVQIPLKPKILNDSLTYSSCKMQKRGRRRCPQRPLWGPNAKVRIFFAWLRYFCGTRGEARPEADRHRRGRHACTP